jgi:HEAT repeat protein
VRIICVLGLALCSVMAAEPQPSLDTLYRDLQSERKADQATVQLLRLADSDGKVKGFLADRLPALIATDPTPTAADYQRGLRVRPVWRNAVQLTGELRIAAAIPALLEWLTFTTSPAQSLGAGEEALVDSPAAMALANIGDPSVPRLQPLLSSGKLDERYEAAYCLLSIDSQKSKSALRDYIANGKDRGLADLISNRLEMQAPHP